MKCNVFWIENLLSSFALKNIRLCQVMCYIVSYEIPHSSGHVDDAIYVTCNRMQPCINKVSSFGHFNFSSTKETGHDHD